MRPTLPIFFLSAAVLTSLAVACSAPAEDDSEDQGGAVTGGTSEEDSPLVYLLASTTATHPTCVGTMLSDTMVVTPKNCANKNLVVKRASDDAKTSARVKAIHVPAEADAEIALLELDTPLKGKTAKLVSMELTNDYHIVGAPTSTTGDESATVVKGIMTSQTAQAGLIVPERGSELCDSDVGASVFRKIPEKALGFLWKHGDWELSGLIMGDVASAPDPDADAGTATDAGARADAGADAGAGKCSGAARPVTPLALQAAFLTKYAPDAAPKAKSEGSKGGGLFGGGFPFPDLGGLLGGGSSTSAKGSLKSCTLVTATLPATKTNDRTPAIQAKASFSNAVKEQVLGQFGIAPKATPTTMVWSAANPLDALTGSTFESRFEGGLNAPAAEGDYLVAFRASADGGSTWTQCDLDGSANGFSATQALALQVTTAAAATPNPAPPPSYSDTSPSSSTSSDTPGDVTDAGTGKKAKKGDDGGCSVTTTPGSASQRGLPFLGLLIGLAAMVRRRTTARR